MRRVRLRLNMKHCGSWTRYRSSFETGLDNPTQATEAELGYPACHSPKLAAFSETKTSPGATVKSGKSVGMATPGLSTVTLSVES